MQMEPRRLVGALIATILAGTSFSVVTTMADASEPTPMPAAASDLGDAAITYPAPTFSAPPLPVATAVPKPPTPTPPTSPAPTPLPSHPSTPSSSATPALETPTPRTSRVPSRAPSAKPRALAATRPIDGWAPPHVRVGPVRLPLPTLTSGAKVSLTIGCVPSTACTVTGDVLTIDPEATSVMLTWTAPGTATHTAWQASKSLG